MYTQEQIVALARLAANNYAESCTGPAIRGLNGEEHLRGKSIEEVAKNNGISVEKAKALTVDLAAVPFDELPEHWQNVNVKTAKDMIALIPSFADGGNDGATVLKTMLAVPNFDVQAKFAAILHDAWLKRPENSWALGTDLDCPFDQLKDDQKAKDVQQLMSLATWLCSLDA